jgi:hypothetical protein
MRLKCKIHNTEGDIAYLVVDNADVDKWIEDVKNTGVVEMKLMPPEIRSVYSVGFVNGSKALFEAICNMELESGT